MSFACWRAGACWHWHAHCLLSNCLSSRGTEEVTLRPCPLPPSSLSSVAPGSSTKRPTSFLISFFRLTTLVCRPFHHPSPSGLGPAPFRSLGSPGRTRTVPDPLKPTLHTRLTPIPRRSLRCRAAKFSSARADEWNKHYHPG